MYNFKSIEGNADTIKNLAAQVKSGLISHAYIFDGERGSGKKTMAKAFAKAALCEKRGGDSCGVCVSCRSFENGNNPDVSYIRPEKTKSIGVDQIREDVNSAALIKPYLYDKKIFIFEGADDMTAQAQNALLKTLEEAPPYCLFLLVADNAGLCLPTILSRCVMIKLKPLPLETVKRRLAEDLSLDESSAALFAGLSNGNIGKAKAYAQSETFIQLRAFVIETLDNINERELLDCFDLAKQIEAFKDDADVMLELCLLWYRDALVYKRLGSESGISQKDIAQKIKKASLLETEDLLKSVELILKVKYAFEHNANFQLAAEVLTLGLSGK